MKTCITCKWCERYEGDLTLSKCLAPQNMTVDWVTGERSPKVKFCDTHRHIDVGCGKRGDWHQTPDMDADIQAERSEVDNAAPARPWWRFW